MNPQIATGIATATPMMTPFEIPPCVDELLATDFGAEVAVRVEVVRRVVIMVDREVSSVVETGTVRDEMTGIPITMETIGCLGSVMVEV